MNCEGCNHNTGRKTFWCNIDLIGITDDDCEEFINDAECNICHFSTYEKDTGKSYCRILGERI
jgi:hypothetical protein